MASPLNIDFRFKMYLTYPSNDATVNREYNPKSQGNRI